MRNGRWLLARLLCCLAFALPHVAHSQSTPTSAPELDLMGTWYVLIHYRDEASENPEVDRWEDRIWVFAKKGSRLAWTEYPIVVFSDPRGRFERTLSGVSSRVLAAWEPNEDQLAEIERGLETNTRGSKTKTLRGSPDKGYRSVGGFRTQSVSVIGYHESWSIEGLPDHPTFVRDDLMGSGRTAQMEGRTQYSGNEISNHGALIRGTYERDGTRHGVFRMVRTGKVVKAGSQRKQGDEPRRPYLSVFDNSEDRREIAALAARGDELSDEERAQLRERLRRTIEPTLRAAGFEGARLEQRSASLAAQVEELLLEQGMTVDQVDAMVSEGKIQP